MRQAVTISNSAGWNCDQTTVFDTVTTYYLNKCLTHSYPHRSTDGIIHLNNRDKQYQCNLFGAAPVVPTTGVKLTLTV